MIDHANHDCDAIVAVSRCPLCAFSDVPVSSGNYCTLDGSRLEPAEMTVDEFLAARRELARTHKPDPRKPARVTREGDPDGMLLWLPCICGDVACWYELIVTVRNHFTPTLPSQHFHRDREFLVPCNLEHV